jgi:phosphoglycerol transferase MdoB-like AlkP superfamily enzyme
MENETIILLISTLLSIVIFFSRYKLNNWESFKLNIPDPWFSIVVASILVSLVVLSVTVYNSTYFSESIKSSTKFIPYLGMFIIIIFRIKNKL